MAVVKHPPANAGDTEGAGSIPGLGRSFGKESGSPLQYFFFFNDFICFRACGSLLLRGLGS